MPLEDCIALFPRLKRDEAFLAAPERQTLLKIEKVLYNCLSIQEVESLLLACCVKRGRTGAGSEETR